MKTMKCNDCNLEIQAENFDGWLKASQAHYSADHADLLKEMMTRPREEGEKWVSDAKARFEAI
jgi:hypothetical protein